jgi:hypothetical protein
MVMTARTPAVSLHTWLVIIAIAWLGASGSAQWLGEPTRGIPRTADGKPNLGGAGARGGGGHPALLGLLYK